MFVHFLEKKKSKEKKKKKKRDFLNLEKRKWDDAIHFTEEKQLVRR